MSPKAGEAGLPPRPLIFLPGWAFDGRILELAAAATPWYGFAGPLRPWSFGEDFLDWLDNAAPAMAVDLVGWSMGAYLALDFACRHPGRVRRLYLLAARANWPAAEIGQIKADYDQDHATFLRRFYRKCFLGERALSRRFEAELLPAYLAVMDAASLREGLDYLAAWHPPTNLSLLASGQGGRTVTLIHGSRDIVAPLQERLTLPGVAVVTLTTAGHLPFLSKDFVLPARERCIRDTFSRAAATYDGHARVQAAAAAQLATLLPVTLPPQTPILEIGCGTGTVTRELARRYPVARIDALDFSPAMIAAARRKVASATAVRFHCEDGEAFLRRRHLSYSLVVSNAALHWFEDQGAIFAAIAAALGSAGQLVATLFGPETLRELGEAMAAVLGDKTPPLAAARFLPHDKLAGLLTSRFKSVAITEERRQESYPDLMTLLRTLKKSGVTGGTGWQPFCLTPGRLREIEARLRHGEEGVTVTYQFFTIACRVEG